MQRHDFPNTCEFFCVCVLFFYSRFVAPVTFIPAAERLLHPQCFVLFVCFCLFSEQDFVPAVERLLHPECFVLFGTWYICFFRTQCRSV